MNMPRADVTLEFVAKVTSVGYQGYTPNPTEYVLNMSEAGGQDLLLHSPLPQHNN